MVPKARPVPETRRYAHALNTRDKTETFCLWMAPTLIGSWRISFKACFAETPAGRSGQRPWIGTPALSKRRCSSWVFTRCTVVLPSYASAAAEPAAWPSIIQVGSTRSELKATRELLKAHVTSRLSHSTAFGMSAR